MTHLTLISQPDSGSFDPSIVSLSITTEKTVLLAEYQLLLPQAAPIPPQPELPTFHHHRQAHYEQAPAQIGQDAKISLTHDQQPTSDVDSLVPGEKVNSVQTAVPPQLKEPPS